MREIFPVKSARARRAAQYLFAFLEKALERRLALPNDCHALQDILGKRAVLQRDSHQTDMPGTKKERLKNPILRKAV